MSSEKLEKSSPPKQKSANFDFAEFQNVSFIFFSISFINEKFNNICFSLLGSSISDICGHCCRFSNSFHFFDPLVSKERFKETSCPNLWPM